MKRYVVWLSCLLSISCNDDGPSDQPPAETTSVLCNLDKSKMVPLRNATYRHYQYVASLKGKAIKGDTPYEIHFDTGSWTTSIPGGALDMSQVTILSANVYDPWGELADKVSGQLIMESNDGTSYAIDNYIFYATKDPSTRAYYPDDRTQRYGYGIMGAFPSSDPYTGLPSFPFALTLNYAADRPGFGIVSDCQDDIEANWSSLKSYLQIGNSEELEKYLNYRTDIPNWVNDGTFQPEAVPGFQVKIDFPETQNTIETGNNLMATVDTGAPDLTLRLGANDFQDKAPFTSHFVKDGPWMYWNIDYQRDAKTLINANVTVKFTDSKGETNEYTFPVGDDLYASPNSMYTGTWNGNVPWPVGLPDKPKNRINLGNTIYFYCPVYFWDIKGKRVGIGFKK